MRNRQESDIEMLKRTKAGFEKIDRAQSQTIIKCRSDGCEEIKDLIWH